MAVRDFLTAELDRFESFEELEKQSDSNIILLIGKLGVNVGGAGMDAALKAGLALRDAQVEIAGLRAGLAVVREQLESIKNDLELMRLHNKKRRERKWFQSRFFMGLI